MMENSLSPVLPSIRLYPEREDPSGVWGQRIGNAVDTAGSALLGPLRVWRRRRFVTRVNSWREKLAGLDARCFQLFVREVRNELLCKGLQEQQVARSYAAIREVARRTIGLEHFDVQVEGAHALLFGAIAELETGEGKTLTATLAAGTAALAGTPVHVITVNDYLARRDTGLMGPVYQALGLSIGVVVSGMSQQERRDAYRADITYCTNKEVAFDYLRDRIMLGYAASALRIKLARLSGAEEPGPRPVMRGLHFAIVDEADSVLIDEARTPLIISDRTDPEMERKRAEEALELVAPLVRDQHFTSRRDSQEIVLTDLGKSDLMARGQALGGPWRGSIFREEQARFALSAMNVYHRNVHYLVRDDKIVIIDEHTGRAMPDRSWGDGIHQLIEVKEDCEVTGQTVPIARMTYQRFFRRYRKLAGMTGTASEARSELRSVYKLPVATISTNRPMIRAYATPRIFTTVDEKWRHITEHTRVLSDSGVPVLIGTRTVASSELASEHLVKAGIAHSVLNAAEDEREAEIISRAGQPGRVTVATNIAGRGVDIALGPGVAELGGLNVILSERQDSRRIDRQLVGRCARQGEPGCAEVVLSLEDSLISDSGVRFVWIYSGNWYRSWLFYRAQQSMERRHARVRRELMRWDQQVGTALAFSGRLE